MSADHDQPPRRGARFNVEDARVRAREALRRSEFILSRAWGLLSEPKKEWEQIRAEATTVPHILVGYVAPLALIPPVCGIIGGYVFGDAALREPLGAVVVSAFATWLVTIALVYALGFIVNAAAANFDALPDELAAQKLAAYSLTPAFLSGVFSLWPPLWWLSLFALAAMVFLIYRGLPILMKAPEDRALAYAATVTVASLVAGIVLFALAGCVT